MKKRGDGEGGDQGEASGGAWPGLSWGTRLGVKCVCLIL